MSEDLVQRIVLATDEDFGSLQVKTVERREEDLLVYLQVETDEDPDLPRDIRVTCRSVEKSNLVPGYYEGLFHSRDHVLLWHYNQPHIISSFHGRVDEPLSVAGALYERHLELAGDWISISRYLGGAPSLSELLRGGFGMLAKGPERLVLAYEEVLSSYGVSVSHHPYAAPQDEELSVLIFDDSYVIAKHFSAEAF